MFGTSVPLDYSDSSIGVAKIALGRYNATSGTRKGSVFVGPGGPGGQGVFFATQQGPAVQALVGEDWDIIGFDPRGIGATDAENRTAFITNTVIDRSYDVSPNVTDPFNRYHLVQTQREADALYKTQFAICAQTMGDTLKYMGTTSVVRDIDHIATLLDGEDSLINFYGLSYGTVTGQYLVNMFPNRVGRVVIDGVVNAETWATVPPYIRLASFLNSTEKAYSEFFRFCAEAGPSSCALASKDNEDPSDIMARVEDFVNGLYTAPLPTPNATLPGMLTNGRARMFLLGTIEDPQIWPASAVAFAQAMAGDASAVLNLINTKGLVDLERSAVTCNDVRPFAGPTPEAWVEVGLAALNISRFALAGTTTEPDDGCEFWPASPPERFEGPFNSTLRNPILIVSNTVDPATPLTNGEAVHALLQNSSALLVQNGPGHTSIQLTSTCTILSTRAYFADGSLPAEGTVCEIDASPFASDNSTASASATASLAVAHTKARITLRRGWGA
ncbi:TAP-like protein-domain-containing protein [Epithele typhae]|uniref:TAP-like protein-domain-containing protein n=1 Tax=Epithele typhae TaxID=378194 RepID=UPI002007A98A|nr:TAP-like protein-domain-containing protein [Epithele typhae]KAH9928020.1 TAP-like protein-domain-containing protein [Epithele typhae]